MNWPLLLWLIVAYVALHVLLVHSLWPLIFYLRRRFHTEFGREMNPENIAALGPEELARWEQIQDGESRRPVYRFAQALVLLFHYPSIVMLGAVLRRNPIPAWPMFFVTGTAYVTIAYFRWR